MSYACEICGKSVSVGRSQHHGRGVAGKRWKKRAPVTPRLFKPNLQKITLKINNVRKSMRICTECLKRIKKYKSLRQYTNITVV
ncbi:hypothetical protein A2714_04960 [Candidatus Woesebacteria bacterium RIFCSPHIGHO2_01_FULL_38_9]|uniref:Large ribosomal subunit protein bL28 n=1 Tax=Candidatus Woesebacteria bacterium RIFCSPHIGHO2_01_FULL_38_9 TaxID=1802492 RepID=A0A1F7XZ71_9BACT|nr:MAG: hypothetical protein A2714_04960 [Candidatus Woesebacteria bacterium RIFCSPHIGHO2_01_FULL_38_9]